MESKATGGRGGKYTDYAELVMEREELAGSFTEGETLLRGSSREERINLGQYACTHCQLCLEKTGKR